MSILRKIANDASRNQVFYLMALPGIVYLLLFHYVPLSGLLIVFKNFNAMDGIWGSPWAGLDNFKFFFTSGDMALRATRNTLALNAMFIASGTAVAVLLAVFLNEVKSKLFQRASQTAIFLPYFLSWVVVGGILYALLSSKGVVNNTLAWFGADPVRWYMNANYWWPILVLVNVWKWAGYNAIIYLATIIGIDSSYYEAAKIDGANKLQQLRYITLPMLRGTIVILTLLAIGRIFYGDLQMIFGLTQLTSMLLPKVDVIDTYVYRSLVNGSGGGDFSIASTVSLYQSILGFALITLANYATKKIDPDYKLY